MTKPKSRQPYSVPITYPFVLLAVGREPELFSTPVDDLSVLGLDARATEQVLGWMASAVRGDHLRIDKTRVLACVNRGWNLKQTEIVSYLYTIEEAN
jgi:hypothetical protein